MYTPSFFSFSPPAGSGPHPRSAHKSPSPEKASSPTPASVATLFSTPQPTEAPAKTMHVSPASSVLLSEVLAPNQPEVAPVRATETSPSTSSQLEPTSAVDAEREREWSARLAEAERERRETRDYLVEVLQRNETLAARVAQLEETPPSSHPSTSPGRVDQGEVAALLQRLNVMETRLETEVSTHKAEAEVLHRRIQELENEKREVAAFVSTLQMALEGLEGEVQARMKGEVGTLTEQRDKLSEENTQLLARVVAAEGEVQVLSQRLKASDKDKTAALAELQETQTRLSESREAMASSSMVAGDESVVSAAARSAAAAAAEVVRAELGGQLEEARQSVEQANALRRQGEEAVAVAQEAESAAKAELAQAQQTFYLAGLERQRLDEQTEQARYERHQRDLAAVIAERDEAIAHANSLRTKLEKLKQNGSSVCVFGGAGARDKLLEAAAVGDALMTAINDLEALTGARLTLSPTLPLSPTGSLLEREREGRLRAEEALARSQAHGRFVESRLEKFRLSTPEAPLPKIVAELYTPTAPTPTSGAAPRALHMAQEELMRAKASLLAKPRSNPMQALGSQALAHSSPAPPAAEPSFLRSGLDVPGMISPSPSLGWVDLSNVPPKGQQQTSMTSRITASPPAAGVASAGVSPEISRLSTEQVEQLPSDEAERLLAEVRKEREWLKEALARESHSHDHTPTESA